MSDETLNRDQALTDLEHVAPLEHPHGAVAVLERPDRSGVFGELRRKLLLLARPWGIL
ncbi:MAG TPA: hypothetical protein VFE60_01385 [Roseiarcus sp.]|nr:hypothetical protein [Roseiarcus sp.]